MISGWPTLARRQSAARRALARRASHAVVGDRRRRLRARDDGGVALRDQRRAAGRASIRRACSSRARLSAGLDGAVGLLTARDLSASSASPRQAGDQAARCVATVGLGNALSAGDPPGPFVVGTINLLVQVALPLCDAALVELLALAAEARTAAVMDARVPSRRSARVATGTGTDCIVVAAPDAGKRLGAAPYAGKHTLLGALAGGAVRESVARGVRRWIAAEVARGVQSPARATLATAPLAHDDDVSTYAHM